ncbi:hypothetical protein ACA910_022696 [Epithemia clementina (nom. ined.)]
MKFSALSIVSLLASSCCVRLVTSADCLAVQVQDNFDLEAYISAPWYVQEQAVVDYLPLENFYCVRAQYEKVGGWLGRTFWGYTVEVSNIAQNIAGTPFGGDLCAFQENKDEEPAKLAVAPCFLPTWFASDYWVVAYEDGDNGYALVSGGQPTVDTGNGCITGDDIKKAGLWVFTRAKDRSDDLVQKVREIAVEKGFDVSVLKEVVQNIDICNYVNDDGGRRRLEHALRG